MLKPAIVIGTAAMAALALAGCTVRETRPVTTAGKPQEPGTVELWLTTPDRQALLSPEPALRLDPGPAPAATITVDPTRRYQSMVGFGAAITDASAHLIQNSLSSDQRRELLDELFGPAPGLHLSFTRLTIGASDFSRSHYSYDDMPKGKTDPTLAHFSIAPAQAEVLPTVRAALAINPDLKVMASPWSAPGWMKTTDSLIQGSLRADRYVPFAAYLRRTIEAFQADGVPVDYLSIQNEPDFEPDSYPGMRLSAAQRARIIGDHVGPTLEAGGLKTRILDWDHNWDKPEHPLGVLADARANRYVSGIAWHCYNGDVDAQSKVQAAYPDKDVFFTECSGGEWSDGWSEAWPWMMRNLIIGTTRNWARGVLLWNLALDEHYGPHLGGCANCRGVVTIDSATGAVTRNPEYYALGHLSRFVAPGAVRIESHSSDPMVDNVAFADPDGTQVLLAFNHGDAPVDIVIGSQQGHFGYRLAPKGAATFRWRNR